MLELRYVGNNRSAYSISAVTCLTAFHSKYTFPPKLFILPKHSFTICVNIRQSAKTMVLLHSNTEFHLVGCFNTSEEVATWSEYSTQSKRFWKKIWVSAVTRSETKLLFPTPFPSTLWIISCLYCVMPDPVFGLLTTSERHRKKEEHATNDEFKIMRN